MNCRECDARTYVVVSQRLPDGIKRLRRCYNCGVSAYTGEVWLTTVHQKLIKRFTLSKRLTR